jgi:hypothetical protein
MGGNIRCVCLNSGIFYMFYLSPTVVALYCFAAFVPDFSSSLGIATIFPLAKQFDTTTTEINDLYVSFNIWSSNYLTYELLRTSNW